MNDCIKQQKYVEMPSALVHAISLWKLSNQGTCLLTTMTPHTLRLPLASPMVARHHAMKRKPITARMIPTIMLTMRPPYASTMIARIERNVRKIRTTHMQIRRSNTAVSDVFRLYASQLKCQHVRIPGQFLSFQLPPAGRGGKSCGKLDMFEHDLKLV